MPSLPPDTAAERLAAGRVGHLATVTAAGRPHVVAVTFAIAGGHVFTAVDAKPKSTRSLQRLENVRATGHASLLVDHYEEDWSRLWWVRVDGPAIVLERGQRFELALDALATKYPQYRDDRPEGPVIALRPEAWRSWIPSGG
jgi:PPOX class probable F420-dependent enzyme